MSEEKNKKKFGAWCMSSIIIVVFVQVVFPKLIECWLSREILQTHQIAFCICKQVFFVLVPAFLWNNIIGNKDKIDLGRTSLSFKGCIIMAVYAVAIFVVIRLLRDAFLWMYIGITEDFSVYRIPKSYGMIEILEIIFGIVVLSSICEEFYYRFVGYKITKNRSWISMAIISIIYAAFYLDFGIGTVISTMLLGLVLGNNYLQYHNYMYVLIIHVIYGVLEVYFTNCIVWVSDCILINVRAFSGAECITWGCIYIVCACCIMLCVFVGKTKIQYLKN